MSDDRMDEFIDEFLARFKKATGFDFKTGKLCSSIQPPQGEPLIQGYTAEQWQEIVGGGYLCEVGDRDDDLWLPALLIKIAKDNLFVTRAGNHEETLWVNCRPAQIKGVMRPIFVEPVGGGTGKRGVFFDEHNQPVESMGKDVDSDIWAADMIAVGATKYLEV